MTPHVQRGDRVLVDGAVSTVLQVRDDPHIHGHIYELWPARVIVDQDFRSGRAIKVDA